jgi:uncharacterized protein
MAVFIQFVIGLVFGTGLVVAGMSDPAKVLNFLDFAAIPSGTWDASLAFVLGGAVIVAALGFRLVLKRDKPVFGQTFHLPTARHIDTRIIVGPALFGIGWGLAGFCPGPALTALVGGGTPAATFVISMLAGMIVARWLSDQQAMTPFPTRA